MLSEDTQNMGLRLLKKGQKGIVHAVFSRFGIILLLLILQFFVQFGILRWFGNLLPHIFGSAMVFTVIMVLYLLNSRIDPTAKITWLVLIMLMPVFGSLLFWYIQSDFGHRVLGARIEQIIKETKELIPQESETAEQLAQESPGTAALVRYVQRSGCHPIFKNTEVTFFPSGEEKFEELLRQLAAAEKFIFLEYFIIDEGLMWGRILEILAQKAKEGVDVRVMYDGTCNFSTLPHSYPKQLKALGIACKVFSPVVPIVSTHYNYRDHRKILVIDGHTAFNGGVNLADEYINHIDRFGHWKDTAVMLKGEAVKSFTLMFLQMWGIDEKEPEIAKFLFCPIKAPKEAQGFVMPYGDCPLDNDKVGERVYMDILNRAQRYVHIMSPYLILDGEMMDAIRFAAERGIEVAMILPGVPDKKIPYALAKTHYALLLESGVKIYEYTPGFVHAKIFVSDDREAVVGTINLDYRSLYHHFECATYLYRAPCISDIETDFQKTAEKCRVVEKDTIWQKSRSLRPVGWVMKVLAPLM